MAIGFAAGAVPSVAAILAETGIRLLLSYLVAIWALVTGAADIVAAIQMRSILAGEWLLMLAGLLSIAFGSLLFTAPPEQMPLFVSWTGWFASAIGIAMRDFALRLRVWHRAGVVRCESHRVYRRPGYLGGALSGLSAPLTPVCLLILDRWDRADRLEKEVLTPTVAMVNEPTGPLLLSLADSLLEGIEGEITPERTRHPPPHDTAAESIDDKGHIDEALPGGHIGEIRDPALVRALGGEVPLHQIEWPLSGIAWSRGSRPTPAADRALKPELPHQALDRTARHLGALSVQLAPDLARAVDLEVLLPNPTDLFSKDLVSPRPDGSK